MAMLSSHKKDTTTFSATDWLMGPPRQSRTRSNMVCCYSSRAEASTFTHSTCHKTQLKVQFDAKKPCLGHVTFLMHYLDKSSRCVKMFRVPPVSEFRITHICLLPSSHTAMECTALVLCVFKQLLGAPCRCTRRQKVMFLQSKYL